MADTVAHIVYLNNQDTGGGGTPPPSTDYLVIEENPIPFIPDPTGNTQYLNRIVVAPNGFLYAIDIAGNAVQFSGTTSNLYQNGLFKTGGVVEFGGSLIKTTALNLNGFNLNFTGTGKVSIGGSNGPEKLNVYGGNLYLDAPGAEIHHKSQDGTLWETGVTNDGTLVSQNGADVRKHLSSIKEGTEAELLAIPFGDRVKRQFYYATDIDMFLYVRDDSSYEYLVRTYTHTQLVPATIWTITHSMRRYPSVSTVDTAGTVIYGEVQYQDLNTVLVLFTSAVGGKAHLN